MFFASFLGALEAKDIGLMTALRADERRHILDHAEDLVSVRERRSSNLGEADMQAFIH